MTRTRGLISILVYIFKQVTVTGVYITMFIKWVIACTKIHKWKLYLTVHL